MMTSALLLTAVSAVLKRTLENGLADPEVVEAVGSDIHVSAEPPDRIKTGSEERSQLNLFLYQLTPNTALRPAQAGAARPYVVDLHYMVSAYGPGDLVIETLLGAALRAFKDVVAFDGARFAAVVAAAASNEGGRIAPPAALGIARAGIGEQVAGLKIEPQFLSLEEASRLWPAFQGHYRPSLYYKVTVTVRPA